MKIYSEKTNQFYEDVDSCIKAEREHEEKLAELKKEKELKAQNRSTRAKEVEEAYKTYLDLLNKFIEDYGSFHMTYSNSNSNLDLLNKLFKFF